MKNKKTIKLKYKYSPIGRGQDQKDTVRCLGFTRLNQIVEVPDDACIRGMINKISHLVEIVK